MAEMPKEEKKLKTMSRDEKCIHCGAVNTPQGTYYHHGPEQCRDRLKARVVELEKAIDQRLNDAMVISER